MTRSIPRIEWREERTEQRARVVEQIVDIAVRAVAELRTIEVHTVTVHVGGMEVLVIRDDAPFEIHEHDAADRVRRAITAQAPALAGLVTVRGDYCK